MLSRRVLLLLVLFVAGCAADTTSPLLRKVRAINADGRLSAVLGDQDLTPFQQLLRDRLPPEPPQPAAIFALEVDVPNGEGTEGEYLAIVRSGSELVLRFYEQADHHPRTDRFFFRQLTAVETIEFDAFLKAHPLADLRHFRPAISNTASPTSQPAGDSEAATEPATKPATELATEPAAASDVPSTPAPPDATARELPIVFRFTDARQDQAQTLVIQSPGIDDHPVIDLLHMLARFRDAAPFAGRYFQTIPLTAKALYADPARRVLYVWCAGDDLRIHVSARSGDPVAAETGERWLAYHEGQWQPGTPPPEFAPQPATEPATEPAPLPATAPATPPATEPDFRTAIQAAIEAAARRTSRPATLPDLAQLLPHPQTLPQSESWWTQPNHNATSVFHYVPLAPNAGTTLGFVVPAFEFDDDHFAVDAARGMLYLIHDGQLFSVPIPPAALKPQEYPS